MQLHVDTIQTKCDVLHTAKTFVYSFQYSMFTKGFCQKEVLGTLF